MSNSMDPDETAHYEPSDLDLCCLQRPIVITYASESVKYAHDDINLYILFQYLFWIQCYQKDI